jgi:3',5'-cyclic-AMP phosphodiesterase
MRVLQLSDPHLLADPGAKLQGRRPLELLQHGLRQAFYQLQASGELPDQLLISGDLCQDESFGGYLRLAEALAASPFADLPPPWLLPGNHDHVLRLRAVLGHRAQLAPALLDQGDWQVLLLDSHRPGCLGGELGAAQRDWIAAALQTDRRPLLVAVHHPPLAIGDASFDGIRLDDGEALLECLARSQRWRALVFGHVHQHWQGERPWRHGATGPSPAGGDGSRAVHGAALLLGCPSCFCSYGPVQPCPLGRAADPGGRLLELRPSGEIHHRLLRWSEPGSP